MPSGPIPWSTTPRQPTDEQLLGRVADGDEAAFVAFYDRLGGLVHGVVQRVLRDASHAEEVTQEVFVEIWRTASRFDADRGSARTWSLTLAHHRAVDRVRSEQASRDRNVRAGHRDRVRPFDPVSEQAELHDEHDRVRGALERLTDLQREVVRLAYYGGMTYREVAELLDVPLGTVKTRLRDGLIRLRDAMGVR